jgi:hypothetical protein
LVFPRKSVLPRFLWKWKRRSNNFQHFATFVVSRTHHLGYSFGSCFLRRRKSMKIVPAFPSHVLATLTLVACTTVAFAGPALPVPQPTTKFGSISMNELVAGPALPVPQPTTKPGTSFTEGVQMAGPALPVPQPTTKPGTSFMEGVQMAGPALPVPQPTTKPGTSFMEGVQMAGPALPVPQPTTKFNSTGLITLS